MTTPPEIIERRREALLALDTVRDFVRSVTPATGAVPPEETDPTARNAVAAVRIARRFAALGLPGGSWRIDPYGVYFQWHGKIERVTPEQVHALAEAVGVSRDVEIERGRPDWVAYKGTVDGVEISLTLASIAPAAE